MRMAVRESRNGHAVFARPSVNKRSRFLVGLGVTAALAGCGGDNVSPMAPSAALVVESTSTSTQVEANGVRVQLRVRVTDGLTDLSQAVAAGDATTRVCLASACTERTISSTFAEGSCTTLVGDDQITVEAAWQNGDTVGVDFCQESAVAARTFSTTVSDGVQRSNEVQTACTPAGSVLACASS